MLCLSFLDDGWRERKMRRKGGGKEKFIWTGNKAPRKKVTFMHASTVCSHVNTPINLFLDELNWVSERIRNSILLRMLSRAELTSNLHKITERESTFWIHEIQRMWIRKASCSAQINVYVYLKQLRMTSWVGWLVLWDFKHSGFENIFVKWSS